MRHWHLHLRLPILTILIVESYVQRCIIFGGHEQCRIDIKTFARNDTQISSRTSPRPGPRPYHIFEPIISFDTFFFLIQYILVSDLTMQVRIFRSGHVQTPQTRKYSNPIRQYGSAKMAWKSSRFQI